MESGEGRREGVHYESIDAGEEKSIIDEKRMAAKAKRISKIIGLP